MNKLLFYKCNTVKSKIDFCLVRTLLIEDFTKKQEPLVLEDCLVLNINKTAILQWMVKNFQVTGCENSDKAELLLKILVANNYAEPCQLETGSPASKIIYSLIIIY
jgi:hypothetical protein